jgi:hypothetical protein
MSSIQLTVREQLIERILRMPDAEVAALFEIVEELEEPLDPAMIEARKKEPAITLDEYLQKLNLSREELEKEARDVYR